MFDVFCPEIWSRHQYRYRRHQYLEEIKVQLAETCLNKCKAIREVKRKLQNEQNDKKADKELQLSLNCDYEQKGKN